MTHAGAVRRILIRDLGTLQAELRAYPIESDIWATPSGLPNSAGTLALHLTGNVRHFIGAVLGNSEYVRNRDREFSATQVPRAELLRDIDDAIREISDALQRLSDDDLDKPLPMDLRGMRFNTGVFLTHLVAHFGYHLGQLDYHRRIVTGNSAGIGAQSLEEIAE